MSDSTTLTLFQESNFKTPSDNNEDSKGGRTTGTRDERCPYKVIMPSHNYSETIKENPTFWVLVQPNLEEKQQSLAVRADLYLTSLKADEEKVTLDIIDIDDLLGDDFPLVAIAEDNLSASGLIGLQFPSTESLEIDEQYKWKIKVTCDESYEAIATKATSETEEYGAISRKADEGILPTPQGYQEEGLWMDMIDALIQLEQTNVPSGSIDLTTQKLLDEWELYLQNVEAQMSKEASSEI